MSIRYPTVQVVRRNKQAFDEMCRGKEFYSKNKEEIISILKEQSEIKPETAKVLIKGLWEKYKSSTLSFLNYININWDDGIDKDYIYEISGPLQGVKILGCEIFKELKRSSFLESFNQMKIANLEEQVVYLNRQISTERNLKENLKLQNENLYQQISKLQKEKLNVNEYIKYIYQNIDEIKEDKRENAILKYCENNEDAKECRKALKAFDAKPQTDKNSKVCLPLVNAVRSAISENDCSAVKALSKPFYLPSITAISTKKNCTYSLFGYACKVNSLETALYLFKAGGGTKQKFEEERTPFMEAILSQNEKIATFIESLGVSVEERSILLHELIKRNDVDNVKKLLEKPIDVNHMDNHQRTPLHDAAFANNIEIADILIKRGASLRAADEKGKLPLHTAAYKNSIGTAKLLIKAGSPLEVKDSYGHTPLHEANKRNNKQIVQLIEQKMNEIKNPTVIPARRLFEFPNSNFNRVRRPIETRTVYLSDLLRFVTLHNHFDDDDDYIYNNTYFYDSDCDWNSDFDDDDDYDY